MEFKKFTADRVFDGFQFVPGKPVVITDAYGTIKDMVQLEEAGNSVQHLNGILTPGFINCHCHLELSHMKDVIPPHTGLVNFLISVVTRRASVGIKEIEEKIAAAEQEMVAGGIVGVADICNTTQTIAVKQKSKIRWHNLVEVINFFDAGVTEKIMVNQSILAQFQEAGLNGVLTPHAPYTISTQTFLALNELSNGKVISIHNQETAAENELYQKGTGSFLQLYEAVKLPFPNIKTGGASSLQTYLPYFSGNQTIILVHNTFLTEADLAFAEEYAQQSGAQVVFCLCPNANLYIENKLPPVSLLKKHKSIIVLGTDSYSSNYQLSIAAEIKTLADNFPDIGLDTILKWATHNGACALRWNDLGTLEKGKKPGLALLETETHQPEKLTGGSLKIL